MEARWVWVFVLLLCGCLESNPQPSPGQWDTGRWTEADTMEHDGPDSLAEDTVPPPGDGVSPDGCDAPEPMPELCNGCGGVCGQCGWGAECGPGGHWRTGPSFGTASRLLWT